MLALLEESRVVDDPRRDAALLLYGLEGISSCFPPHGPVVPLALRKEVQELAVDVMELGRVGAGASGDGLDAFALTVTEDARRVHRERLALAPVLQVSANRKHPVDGIWLSGGRPR